jgi:hypothetical protein
MIEDTSTLSANIKSASALKKFEFPISFAFKISTFANDFVARDASGRTIAYVRQKMFKFKEAIMIYADESKTDLLYKINADRMIDFNARYAFSDPAGKELGSVGRKGMKSLWRAHYDIFDSSQNLDFHIREENPWTKVFDSMLGQVPVLGLFTGYLFHPKYLVTNAQGLPVGRLSKESSLFGRRFKLDQLAQLVHNDTERIILSLMMMVLLERRRG